MERKWCLKEEAVKWLSWEVEQMGMEAWCGLGTLSGCLSFSTTDRDLHVVCGPSHQLLLFFLNSLHFRNKAPILLHVQLDFPV